MNNPMNLQGKRILVTGASSGIGRATAILISKLGGQVVLIGRNEKKLKETYEQLEQENHTIKVFNLCKFHEYKNLFQQILEDGEKLSGLVHCAGIAKVIPIKVVSYQNILEMMEIHFFSFMELVKHYAKKNNSFGGSIVAISAINAHYPQKCMSVYAASKGALEMAVASLAVELGERGIRVNTVIPGPIKTPMAERFGEIAGEEAKILGQQVMSIGEPEDVANMIAFLLSDASKFVTGRNYYVDGGRL